MGSIYDILSYCSACFTIVPFGFGLLRLKYLSKNEKIIFIYITLALLAESGSIFYEDVFNLHNILILNIYTIFEAIIICVYYYLFFSNKNLKLLIIISALSFTGISIYQIIVNEKNAINDVSFTIESVIITFLSILTFSTLVKNAAYSNILSAPVFWINSGFLLFFSGNLLLHLFSGFLQIHAQQTFYELWGFHSVLNIILYILISIGFWKTRTLHK